MTTNHPTNELITVDEAMARLRRSRAGFYSLLKRDESFPKAIRIGPRSVRWVAAEVDSWIASRPRVDLFEKSTAPKK